MKKFLWPLLVFILAFQLSGAFASDDCFDLMSRVLSRSRVPKVGTVNSKIFLLDSIQGVLEKFPRETKSDLKRLASFNGQKIFVDSRLPKYFVSEKGETVSLEILLSVPATLERALVDKLSLSSESAVELSNRVLRIQLESLGSGIEEFSTFLQKYTPEKVSSLKISRKKLLEVTEEFQSVVNVSRDYDIPYLAGYSYHNPKQIYLDRGIPLLITTKAGNEVDVGPFLVIHEAVEKALIDELQLTKNSYHRTHQIAQRMEKEAVLASGLTWQEYQYDIMKTQIDRAFENVPTRSPYDLDFTPYMDEQDFDLIKRMQKLGGGQSVIHLADQKFSKLWGIFEAHEIRPEVVHLKFDEQEKMAKTMMRFQEHFESPEYKGKFFGRMEYKKWYKKKNDGKFDYYEYWDGFNFPGHILEPFYQGKFPNLTSDERALLKFFEAYRGKKFYVIATAEAGDPATLKHEIAHAMYYLNPSYKLEIEEAFNGVDREMVKKFLFDKMGDYHPDVLNDESHAWLMNNLVDMQEMGFKSVEWKNFADKLNEIFMKYDTGSAN